MRIPRPAAEKLGVDRQDPDLDGLLLGLIRRATGGCHEHAARANRPQDDWVRKRVKGEVSWPGSRWRLERRGRRDSIGAGRTSYALTKQSRFRVREIFLSRQLLNIQRSLSALREAGTLPRSARIKWGAGTPDAPLQVPSGTESMLMNAALARVYASSSDAWRSRLA